MTRPRLLLSAALFAALSIAGAFLSAFGPQRVAGVARVENAAAGLVARGIKAWLAARPVYRFKDDVKGVVLRAVIEDVAVDGDRLVIRASLIRLTAAVAGWLCGLVVVALGAGLIAFPAATMFPGRARQAGRKGRAPPA